MNVFKLIRTNASDEKIIEVIKILNDINVTDQYYGWTSLHFACYYDRSKIVKLLIECGVDVNIKSNNGWTPLQYACCYDRFEVVKLLIECGAETQSQFEVYFSHKNINKIRLLTKAGVCFL